jgi:hypothetical protein
MTRSSVLHEIRKKESGRVAQITIGVVNPADVSREKAGTRMSPPNGTDIRISKGVMLSAECTRRYHVITMGKKLVNVKQGKDGRRRHRRRAPKRC